MDIQDGFGRIVYLPRVPQRIVALSPGHTEILFSLGLDEQIVGVTDYCDYPPQARDKARIGGFATPDVARVAALEPDLVLASGINRAAVDALAASGVPVLAFDPKSLAEVREVITLIGGVTGRTAAAARVTGEMQAQIAWVTEQLEQLLGGSRARPRVFFACPYPGLTPAAGTIIHDLITLAGGANIAADQGRGFIQVPLALIQEQDPEVILFAYSAAVGEHIQADPAWERVTAVRQGRLYLLDKGLVNHPGPRLADGLRAVFAALWSPPR